MTSIQKQHGLIMLVAVAISIGITMQQRSLQASTLRLDPNTTLAACTPEDIRYAKLFFNSTNVETWVEKYHEEVEKIVEDYSKPIQAIACLDEKIFPIEKNSPLYTLAQKLPPWSTASKLDDLQRNDVGFVLLEFLRIYECAMQDRKNFPPLYAQKKYLEEQKNGNIPSNEELRLGEQSALIRDDNTIIEEELAVARPTLEKTLLVITGNNRLSVLDAELQCLQRASLDIRNALSLGADTSSCLPRIWNSKDVLRNLAE